jgi:hypothetical protein
VKRFCALKHLVLTGLWLFFSAAPTLTADWIRELQGDVTYDDNVPRSRVEANTRDDFIFDERAHFGRYDELGNSFLFSITGDAEKRNFARYGDFNNTALGVTASLRYRFGLGPMAPFIRVEANAGYTFFEQNVLAHPVSAAQPQEIGQDGEWGRGQITIGKRLTDRFAMDVGYVYYHFEGPIRVFQRSSNALLLNASYDLTSSTRLTASYELADGEVISYNVPPLPGEIGFPSPIVPLANAILKGVDTFGLGRAPNGASRLYNAYNIHAISQTFTVGISQALTKSVSFDLRYEHNETSRDPLSYRTNLVRASIHATF